MAKKKSIQPEVPVLNENQTIVRWNVADLKVNPLNAQIYHDEDVEDLVESITKIKKKILVPLVITPEGVIISGHRRYSAAVKLGISEVNVIIENIDEKDMEFRMIQYNVYRRKKYSDIIIEIEKLYQYYGRNQGRRTDLTFFNSEEGQKLDVYSQIAKTVGLSTGAMSTLLGINKLKPEYIARIDTGETSLSKAWDRCKNESKAKIIKTGIYEPGGQNLSIDAKVYNKSCADMSEEIEDNSVQLIFTSPPYYQQRDYDGGPVELGQESTPEEFISNLTSILKDCHRVLKEEGSFFLNLGDTRKDGELLNIPQRVLVEVLKHGYKLVHSIIWTKTNAKPLKDFRILQPSYETIFHIVKDLKKYTFNEDVARPFLLYHLPRILRDEASYHPIFGEKLPFDKGSILDYWPYHDILRTSSFHPILEMLDLDEDHPAPMNSIAPILPILLTTKEEDIVLDIFSGSGMTGIISILNSRNYRGYEINTEYYEKSVKRLKSFTGE